MAIAIDAMGGDSPIKEQLQASLMAINDFGIEVVIVGNKELTCA